ncbi:MAG: ABC transporter ATP-binding protein [Bryobacteraceae bacterium]
MTLLSLDSLTFRYGDGPTVVDRVTAQVSAPELIAIIGPNGAGKSTLLDLIAGHKTPAAGTCRLQDRDAARMDRRQLCRIVAHVPQQMPSDVPFTVEEVVLTGRIPHGRGLYENAEDLAAMEVAIERVRLEPFRHRRFSSLSGGERQRVLLAAALCQQSPILLLDEPSAHLDPENEAQLWSLLCELRSSGHLILVVTHHLALAAQHADRIWVLHRGHLAADAPPAEAMQPKRLEEVFHVPFHWHRGAEGRVFLTYGH